VETWIVHGAGHGWFEDLCHIACFLDEAQGGKWASAQALRPGIVVEVEGEPTSDLKPKFIWVERSTMPESCVPF